MKSKNDTLILQKRYLNTIELAEYIGKSRWWVYSKIKRREIPFIPVGRQPMFDINIIDEWMAKRLVGSV